MNIAYLIDWNPFCESGVLNKINDQCARWLNQGHKVKLLIVATRRGDTPVSFVAETIIFTSPLSFTSPAFLYSNMSKICSVRRVVKVLNDFETDVLYYRQGLWYPGLGQIFRAAKTNVMEVNTNDLEESKHWGPVKRVLHLSTRRWVVGSVQGVVAVTKEIGALFESYKIPVKVIANGIQIKHCVPKDFTSVPSVIFVGTPGYAWHGLDKFYQMARSLPNFEFHVVGPDKTISKLDNVVEHGYLDKHELERLMLTMHVAVSTLALHRKGMNEACPLKTREYMRFRMPIILAYIDTDLKKEYPWALRLANNDNCVLDSIDEIEQFVLKMSETLIPFDDLESFSLESKESKRLRFFQNMLGIDAS